MTFEPSASCGLGPLPHLGQARKGRGRLQGAAAGRLALQAAGRWLGCLRSPGCHFTGCRPVIAPHRTYGCWAGRCGAGAARAAVLARAARGGGWGPAARLLMVGGGLRGADLGPQCACGPRQRVVDAFSCRASTAGQPPTAQPLLLPPIHARRPAHAYCARQLCRPPCLGSPGRLTRWGGPSLPSLPPCTRVRSVQGQNQSASPSRAASSTPGVAVGDGGEGPPPPCFLVQLAARGERPLASNTQCMH